MSWSSKWGEPVKQEEKKLLSIEDITKATIEFSKELKIPSVPQYEPVSVGKDEGQAAVDAMQALGVPETRTIKVGNKNIQVIVVGDLGLDFCEPGEKDEGWNIYHLPTLACFSSAVPGYIGNVGWLEAKASFDYDNQQLLNWMAKVQFTGDSKTAIMWNELRRLTPLTYENSGRTAKDVIKQWCLSVKVE